MEFHFKIDASKALELVQRQLPNAAPYVNASFLTGVSKRVQSKMQAQLPVAFDRPTPFTVRGVFTKSAKTNDQKAAVYFPDSGPNSGMSLREYIRPGAKGAFARKQKRTEALLVRSGYLPPGWITTPGRWFTRGNRFDKYGNISGAYYKQIVNILQLKKAESKSARNVYAASQKRVAKMGVENEFFAVTPGKNALAKGGGWLPPGVYRRTGKNGRELIQYLKFVRKASYRPRLDVVKIARAEVRATANAEFSKAWSGVIGRFAARKGITR